VHNVAFMRQVIRSSCRRASLSRGCCSCRRATLCAARARRSSSSANRLSRDDEPCHTRTMTHNVHEHHQQQQQQHTTRVIALVVEVRHVKPPIAHVLKVLSARFGMLLNIWKQHCACAHLCTLPHYGTYVCERTRHNKHTTLTREQLLLTGAHNRNWHLRTQRHRSPAILPPFSRFARTR
jgi:hypothetical protein